MLRSVNILNDHVTKCAKNYVEPIGIRQSVKATENLLQPKNLRFYGVKAESGEDIKKSEYYLTQLYEIAYKETFPR